MIFLTIIAFLAVAYNDISDYFRHTYYLVIGVIQVIFQLYYFMHASQKGHSMPMLLYVFSYICSIHYCPLLYDHYMVVII